MECNICLNYYTINRLPYVGSCGHSFCLECWIKTSQVNNYTCPLCKTSMPLDNVVKNFLAVEFLENNGILTISGLINEYKDFSENFEKKYDENNQIKNSIIELKREKKDIIDYYKKEAYESVIEEADKEALIMMNKTSKLSEKIISETEEIILKIFLDVDNSLKIMKDKLELFKEQSFNPI